MENQSPEQVQTQPNPPQPPSPPTPQQPSALDSHTIVVILLLIFLYPVDIIVMWMWMKHWPTWLKWLLTLLLLLPIVLGVLFAVTLIAIDPAAQLEKARETQNSATDLNAPAPFVPGALEENL